METAHTGVTKTDGLLSVMSVSVSDSGQTDVSRVTEYNKTENTQEVS
jgi:hypothetical protein